MIKEEDLRKIGIFAKPHGAKGEISLLTNYDIADLSTNADLFMACNIDEIYVPFFIESLRKKSASNILVKFENSGTADDVKFLSGKSAFISAELLPPPDGDLPLQGEAMIGYTIVDDRFGLIGTVIDMDNSSPNILLKVDYKGIDILVPLSLVTSIQHQTMNTSLPDGFLELYTITDEKAE